MSLTAFARALRAAVCEARNSPVVPHFVIGWLVYAFPFLLTSWAADAHWWDDPSLYY